MQIQNSWMSGLGIPVQPVTEIGGVSASKLLQILGGGIEPLFPGQAHL